MLQHWFIFLNLTEGATSLPHAQQNFLKAMSVRVYFSVVSAMLEWRYWSSALLLHSIAFVNRSAFRCLTFLFVSCLASLTFEEWGALDSRQSKHRKPEKVSVMCCASGLHITKRYIFPFPAVKLFYSIFLQEGITTELNWALLFSWVHRGLPCDIYYNMSAFLEWFLKCSICEKHRFGIKKRSFSKGRLYHFK